MVAIDHFGRKIMGIAAHANDYNGVAFYRMLYKIISGEHLLNYLFSDKDSIFFIPSMASQSTHIEYR